MWLQLGENEIGDSITNKLPSSHTVKYTEQLTTTIPKQTKDSTTTTEHVSEASISQQQGNVIEVVPGDGKHDPWNRFQ